jgi:UDP:flavonoid glycosyltransferase YjiC (YdhE family)
VARFLGAAHPITGHVLPGIAIVTELVRRGHDVHWYVGGKFRATAEHAGASFEPYVHALDYYDAAFPGRRALSGLRQLTYDFRKVFIEQVSGQHHDLTAILERFPADATWGTRP